MRFRRVGGAGQAEKGCTRRRHRDDRAAPAYRPGPAPGAAGGEAAAARAARAGAEVTAGAVVPSPQRQSFAPPPRRAPSGAAVRARTRRSAEAGRATPRRCFLGLRRFAKRADKTRR